MGRPRLAGPNLVFRPSTGIFLAIFLLVLAAAFNTGENLLYLVAAGVLSFLVSALVLSSIPIRRLKVSRDVPASVYRLDPFTVRVRIENQRRFIPSVSLRIEDVTNRTGGRAYVAKIPPGCTATVRLDEVLPKRGLHSIPALAISSGFPLGLFRRRRTFTDSVTVVVYPRVVSLHRSVIDQVDESGSTPRPLDMHGDEFFGLREYVPGDDVRYICWRVSARVGELMVRQLEPSMARTVVIVFDTRGVPDTEELEEQFEEAVDLVASLAMTFLDRQYAVSVMTPDASVGVATGNPHATRILEMLARVEPADYGSHGDSWFQSAEDLASAAHVFVASDPSMWGGLVAGRGVRILDPREIVNA